MRTPILLATVTAVALLAAAPAAQADTTLCVHQPATACPAGTTDVGSNLQSALDQAGSDGQPTTVRVLAGTYTGPFLYLYSEPLILAGAGSGNTILSGGSTVLQVGCPGSCSAGTFAVHDIGLQLTDPGSAGLGVTGAFDAHDIAVTSTTSSGALVGIALAGTATLEHAIVALPQTAAPTVALRASGVDTASDLNLVADIGISATPAAGLTVSRATIGADVTGIDSHGPGTLVDDALIRLTGDSSEGATSIATGVTSYLNLTNSTILAGGTNEAGIFVQSEGSQVGNHQGTADVTNSILWGVSLTEYCLHGVGGKAPAVNLRYDDIDPAGSTLNCVPTTTHPLAVTPGFLTAGDARLPHDSPLVDRGDPTLTTAPGATDLAGNARLADGDGDGTAIRDIGAYEYGRRPPVAAVSAPASATPGQTLTFDASHSFDPDPGESLTYHWDFGDGASAATAVATHAFATTGTHVATASMTDPTGQTTSAHVTVTIPGPGAPAAPATTPAAPTTSTTTPATTTSPAKSPGKAATTTTPGATPGSPATATRHGAAAKLTLTVGRVTAARLRHGLRVSATLNRAGHVTLRLRAGSHTLLVRHLTFTRAGRHAVVLRLSPHRAASLHRATLIATLAESGTTTAAKRFDVRH